MADPQIIQVGAPWWSALVGAVVGFGLAEVRELFRRRRTRHGHFEALAAEIQICADIADGYHSDAVMAPAYRMPLVAYRKSLPSLLSDGALSFEEVNTIIRFYINAQAFNFSLDQAQSVLMQKEESRPPKRLELEVRRARLKASKLRRSSKQFEAAIAVIKKHLPCSAQQRLTLTADEIADEGQDA